MDHTNLSLDHLRHLPSFARYILDNKLQEYIDMQLKFSADLNVPVLKYLNRLTDEEIFSLSRQATVHFLTDLAQNKAMLLVESSVIKWVANQLPQLDQSEISSEDITLLIYLRKKLFLHFIPAYCQSISHVLDLMDEISRFFAVSTTAFTQTYTDLYRQKLEEQERFIQQVADASPTILYLYDVEQDSFVYVNKEIYFVLEYTVDETLKMSGNLIRQLYHPNDKKLLPERKGSPAKFHHYSSMKQFECRMKKKSGEWCWMLVREVVFKTGEEGKPLQILGAALDINRRKEVEKDLIQKSLQLEQSNTSLEEFAYVASHDLKEPLRKISTFGDRLQRMIQEDARPEEQLMLNKINDASQRMQAMIDDILSISMISGNRLFQLYSLNAILEEILPTLEYKIEQKNAIITTGDLPEANIIPAQFRQLFLNLLSNSLKFAREDIQPEINIHCTYLKSDELGNYSLSSASQYLQIEFKDNGIGFENEFSGKIFQIFHRLHGRAEYEGSGIGLAICKKIVEHHGGVIFANGIPDMGAVFTIILPA